MHDLRVENGIGPKALDLRTVGDVVDVGGGYGNLQRLEAMYELARFLALGILEVCRNSLNWSWSFFAFSSFFLKPKEYWLLLRRSLM